MSNESNTLASPETDWQAGILRLTGLFPSEETNATDTWKTVVGEEPELTTKHKGIEQKVEGPFQDRKLSLVVRPGRVDWALSAAVPTEEALADMITMGTLSDSLTVLGDVADRWMQLDRCPTFQRLAVAIVLLLPMESEQAGYERLSTYLPHVELDPVNSSDFYYQINRPRMSRVLGSELRINRLSKWSVGMWRRAMLTSGRAKDLPGSTQYACRAELDVNTDADFEGQIEVAQMSPLFAELVKYVVEISNEGDRP